MYIPHTDAERATMLERIGVASIDELFVDVPDGLPLCEPDVPVGLDEAQAQRLLRSLASANKPATATRSFLGGGAYQHFIPAVVNSIVSRGELLTAYTPYQPEASQGALTAIYEFQSMVAELYGLDVANASLYDGASALAEAAIVAARHTRRGKLVVSETVHPTWRATMECYLRRQDVEIVVIPHRDGRTDLDAVRAACDVGDASTAAVVFQHPNVFGRLEPVAELCDIAHERKALAVTCGHPLAFGQLAPPGQFGADIACGEGQPLGLPLSYGGPYLGLLAVKANLMRKIPGRLAGKTVDTEGAPGYMLTLQTREQHIRREKATSNICSNQALCAMAATVYLATLGKEGYREVSGRNFQNADRLRRAIAEINNVSLPFDGPCFNEFVVRVPGAANDVLSKMKASGVLGGVALGRWFPDLADCILVCTTEVHDASDHDAYVAALMEAVK